MRFCSEVQVDVNLAETLQTTPGRLYHYTGFPGGTAPPKSRSPSTAARTFCTLPLRPDYLRTRPSPQGTGTSVQCRRPYVERVSVLPQVKFEMSDETTLADLLQLNLHKYEDEVRNIVDKAVKESGMEKVFFFFPKSDACSVRGEAKAGPPAHCL